MIDTVDARLQAWVENVLGTVHVAMTPPRDTPDDPVVHLYLMQVVPALASPDARTNGFQQVRSSLQVTLSYLVAVRAADVQQAHKLLGDLIFAALDSAELDLSFDPLPLDLWIALGTEPQPAFVLRLPLTRDLPVTDAPLVRKPLVTRVASITSLQGVVLGGEDDLPLHGALVELPGLHLRQRTDSHGRFRFPTVPADPPVKNVRVTAKGREIELEIDHALASDPVIIRLSDGFNS